MIEDDVLAMERRSLHDFLGPEEVARIFELKVRTHAVPAHARGYGRAGAARSRPLSCISAEMTPYFHDVADHVHRDAVHGRRPPLLVLSTVFEASSLLEAQRTVITRQLAAWAVIQVPTAIAGIYGMNFKHMPELDTAYGYLGRARSDSDIVRFPFVRFKKAKWL